LLVSKFVDIFSPLALAGAKASVLLMANGGFISPNMQAEPSKKLKRSSDPLVPYCTQCPQLARITA
jgi:hypothetical protein